MRNFLDKIFRNKKVTILVPIIISLLLYFFYVLLGTGEEKNNLLIITPIASLFWYFGVFLVIYIQIKNPMCPEGFLDFFEIMATFFFGIGSVIIVILGLIDGMKNFNPLYIASCLTFSSISWAHSKRLKKY